MQYMLNFSTIVKLFEISKEIAKLYRAISISILRFMNPLILESRSPHDIQEIKEFDRASQPVAQNTVRFSQPETE